MIVRNEKEKGVAAIACIAVAVAACLVVAHIYRGRRRRRGCSEVDDKPQNHFKSVLADNSYVPFTHMKCEGMEKEGSYRMHPYGEEINFLLEHPPSLLEVFSNIQNVEMGCPYIWINTEYQLKYLAERLNEERVFAVDTEQHSLRSFLGFTALIQISTKKEDFLLDTIALHDVMSVLQPVFANPSICKVFHGADNDILWLQRDFHIYVVNMFDTAKACEVLSKPQKSLAFLLETYCGVWTDKSLQVRRYELAFPDLQVNFASEEYLRYAIGTMRGVQKREDWRQRPLSAEMIEYARTDAHYLLHIAGCLASELNIASLDDSACPDDKFNFFYEASRRSNTVCLQLYAKEIDSPPGASAAASIISRNWSMEGIHTWKSPETKDLIFKLCAWRDLMARVHDESLRYVLSDHAIVSLAAKIPKNPEEILDFIEHTDLINGSPNIYPSLPPISCVVRSHIDEVCLLLQDHSADIGTIMERIQQKHLDPTGCCSVSIYNYALFSESSLKQNHSLFSWHSGGKSTAPVGRKGSRELFVEKFSCKSPVYHNYRIYANDGRLLCYCDRRKLDWYLRRDLAKVVEDDPPAIMLLFEPKGRPEDEDNEFYIQSKKNICVGCGEKNHYLRYRIIPSCYRMHFPEHLKSHRSHDIVLVCVDCHEVAHAAAEKHKKQIAADFGIPLFVEKIANSGETNAVMVRQHSKSGDESGVSPLQLRTAAMALLRHGSHMPSNRRDELMQVVKTYYGGREVKPEDLETALLVGMSPHERRRLEKKKGLISRKHKGTDTQGNIASSPVETSANETKLNTIEQSLRETLEDVHFGEADLEQMLSLTNGDISTDIQIDEKQSLPRDACASTDSNEMVTSSQNCMFGPVYSSKRASRLSLLGHGHHGKEVVERLLQEQGEDGILTFCQKWRQVFVEAVNPRFLPAGWDIMHSGRRAFGEYSVYNPAKKIQLNLMN